MDSLEYRAFDKHKREWIEYFSISPSGKVFTNEDWDNEEVYTAALMKFTGLVDKNNRGIYQGDILDKFASRENFVVDDLLEFGWLEGEWGHVEETTVIGNIYDNPELIK